MGKSGLVTLLEVVVIKGGGDNVPPRASLFGGYGLDGAELIAQRGPEAHVTPIAPSL
jgi:hypothetical protein